MFKWNLVQSVQKNLRLPNDGYFIEKTPNDSFSSEGTVRYGEEQDVDDL